MKAIFKIICMVYATILRPLVLKAIDNPDSEIDDFVMARLDDLFNYGEDDK